MIAQLDKTVPFVASHPTRVFAYVHLFGPLISRGEGNMQTTQWHNVFHACMCKVMMKVRHVVLMKEEANCVAKPDLTSMTPCVCFAAIPTISIQATLE